MNKNQQWYPGPIINEIFDELIRAEEKFAPFNSEHEGYAVLLEELDELWDEIKLQNKSPEKIRKEAIQVSAMAIRFIKDCCQTGEKEE